MPRVVHFEIPASDPQKVMDFYKKVFNWNYQQFGPHEYWLAITGPDDQPGINGAIMKRQDPRQPLTNAIAVENIDEAIKMIEENGGKIVLPKTSYTGAGWSAYFTDPDNNIICVWQDDKNAP